VPLQQDLAQPPSLQVVSNHEAATVQVDVPSMNGVIAGQSPDDLSSVLGQAKVLERGSRLIDPQEGVLMGRRSRPPIQNQRAAAGRRALALAGERDVVGRRAPAAEQGASVEVRPHRQVVSVPVGGQWLHADGAMVESDRPASVP